MRFMVIMPGDEQTEAGAMPPTEALAAMGKYNEELVNAGVMLAGDGLHPTSKGARVTFKDGNPTVTDGPFTEAKEVIAGFWIWQVDSKEEAIEWIKKMPHPPEGELEIQLRQVFEADDFGEEFTPELREQEERLRKQAEANAQG